MDSTLTAAQLELPALTDTHGKLAPNLGTAATEAGRSASRQGQLGFARFGRYSGGFCGAATALTGAEVPGAPIR